MSLPYITCANLIVDIHLKKHNVFLFSVQNVFCLKKKLSNPHNVIMFHWQILRRLVNMQKINKIFGFDANTRKYVKTKLIYWLLTNEITMYNFRWY